MSALPGLQIVSAHAIGRTRDPRHLRILDCPTAAPAMVDVEKGEYLFEPPASRDCVFRVESGVVMTSRVDGRGNRRRVELVQAGGILGEGNIIGAEASTDTAVAITPSRLSRLGGLAASGNFDVPTIMMLGAVLASRTRVQEENVTRLRRQYVSSRVAHLLCELAAPSPAEETGLRLVHGAITQPDLALMAWTTREAINECLGEFEGRGWLVRSGQARSPIRVFPERGLRAHSRRGDAAALSPLSSRERALAAQAALWDRLTRPPSGLEHDD
jgi:CRP-like cAMP-binding protein